MNESVQYVLHSLLKNDNNKIGQNKNRNNSQEQSCTIILPRNFDTLVRFWGELNNQH